MQENAVQWCTDGDEAANQLCLPNSLKRRYLEENGCTVGNGSDGIEVQSLYDPIKYEASSALQMVAPHELNSQQRDSAISRYKEKKKARRYHHHP